MHSFNIFPLHLPIGNSCALRVLFFERNLPVYCFVSRFYPYLYRLEKTNKYTINDKDYPGTRRRKPCNPEHSYTGCMGRKNERGGENLSRHHVQKPVAPFPPRRPLRGGGQTAQDDACRRVPQDGGRTVHEGL